MTTNPAGGCTTPCIACMTDESHDPAPSPSPCRRTDEHDAHVFEVYNRPFQCPGRDKPRTDAERLAELGPLAAVIADKLRTVPVRLGPGGADNLVSELTLAVAVYCGKHVLPAGAPSTPAEFELRGTTETRATAYRDAADIAMNEASRLYDDVGQKAAAGARAVAERLRRMADEEQQP
ncbi:hypothetical protein OG746_26875 [Streptomyces sp. NBC_01016]|uniref:hypothetical protein n=1 Tax=Streptomyces sp. NBC_01016 TaxID=2903720 RepID=UPI00225B5B30|nr:hypothetical protein [Streptomyces sp. NBC_01016]MCX4827145.1 hypothetical protein [Streptomyces sp. NBC_01016]MCX4832366.1 hypothetical protein [Streptomyces sp. NBC_01016]